MKLTALQNSLLQEASTGPVCCYGQTTRTAGQLAAKGIGKTVSNPGNDYRGQTRPKGSPNGCYFVRSDWEMDQATGSYRKAKP